MMTINLQDVADKILSDIDTNLREQARIIPHQSNWASVVPDPCLRKQVYFRLDWDKQSLPEPYLQGIFETGRIAEDHCRLTLNQIGIRSNPQWQLLKDPKKINDQTLRDYEIGGVTDLYLEWKNNGTAELLGPVEVKSIDPNIYRNIHTLEDFNKYGWMRNYNGQLSIYEFGSNFEQGFFLLLNKTNWWDYKLFPHRLDINYVSDLLERLKVVNECVRNREYPDRITDRLHCERCPFKQICLPDEQFESVELIDNEEILALLDLRDDLKQWQKEYEEVDEQLKAIWKTTKAGTYMVGGKYQVKIVTQSRTNYEIPADIKEQYKTKSEFQKATITKIK